MFSLTEAYLDSAKTPADCQKRIKAFLGECAFRYVQRHPQRLPPKWIVVWDQPDCMVKWAYLGPIAW